MGQFKSQKESSQLADSENTKRAHSAKSRIRKDKAFYVRKELLSRTRVDHLRNGQLAFHPVVSEHRDSRNRLHSLDGPAIEWIDDVRYWFIDGIRFEPAEWEKIASGKMTSKEAILIPNLEKRRGPKKGHRPEGGIPKISGTPNYTWRQDFLFWGQFNR